MRIGLAIVALALVSAPAAAEVRSVTDAGFEVTHAVTVPATADAWGAIARPASWWNASHTFSGDAENLSLDPVVGGCFCENTKDGVIQHGRVIFVTPSSLMRLNAPLGLDADAITARLSFTLTKEAGGTRIAVSYIVGGYSRLGMAKLAPIVDGVIGEQVKRLEASLKR